MYWLLSNKKHNIHNTLFLPRKRKINSLDYTTSKDFKWPKINVLSSPFLHSTSPGPRSNTLVVHCAKPFL